MSVITAAAMMPRSDQALGQEGNGRGQAEHEGGGLNPVATSDSAIQASIAMVTPKTRPESTCIQRAILKNSPERGKDHGRHKCPLGSLATLEQEEYCQDGQTGKEERNEPEGDIIGGTEYHSG